ncbi:MAG: hypothetical protein HS116_05180 [Planctomycetes bacterium]|nr:hypothetical protein [Planctomycetota bacterium]
MAKVIELSLEGAEELNKALAAMTPKIAKGIVRRAMRPAMKPILQAVRAGAPVYWGYLRAGIKMRAVPSKRGVFGVQVQLPYREDLPIAPNDPTYYPASIEYGYTTKSGKHIAAKPFLRPAYDHNEANAERIFKAEVGKLIEEAWKK